MTDRIQSSFELWAQKQGFTDLTTHMGRYNRAVVRWMWSAWLEQSERITDMAAALDRSHKRSTELLKQCRDHDTRRAAAVAQCAAMAEEIERLNETITALTRESRDAQEQEPVAWLCGADVAQNKDYAEWFTAFTKESAIPLYARPVPAAPAVAVPAVPSGWNIRRDGDVLIVQHPDIGGCSVQKEPDWERMIPEAILYSLADALLQSRAVKDSLTTQADCRTCANRGQVNGLSQESYCDSCIYQGRDWRKNHFVDASKTADAVKRRCDACAVLPCSCK